MMHRGTSLLTLVLGVVFAQIAPLPARGSEAWTIVVPACEERITDGVGEDVTLISSLTDGGNRAIVGGTGTGYRYFWCPVWVPSNTYFNRIQIRAFDNTSTAGNNAWAGLYRQPWTSGSGNATSLGSVVSADSANMPNVTEAAIAGLTIDNNTYTFFIIARVARTASGNDIRAYQVKLYNFVGLASDDTPVQEPMDCGIVEAKSEWERTADEVDRCILPSRFGE